MSIFAYEWCNSYHSWCSRCFAICLRKEFDISQIMEVFGAFGAVVAAEFTGDLYCCPFCCFISPVCKFSFLKNFEIRHTAKIPQKGFGKDLPTEHGAKTLVSRVDFHWNQPSRFRGWTKMEAGSSISPRPVNFAPICSSKMLTWNHDWLPKMFFFTGQPWVLDGGYVEHLQNWGALALPVSHGGVAWHQRAAEDGANRATYQSLSEEGRWRLGTLWRGGGGV